MIYKIKFGKSIEKEFVYEFNMLNITEKTEKELEVIHAISKDGQQGSSIDDFYSTIQIKNKYIIEKKPSRPAFLKDFRIRLKNMRKKH